eukprot:m.44700 g.44700  ORF g.44700 m.44700 type:complete len:545 (+) comp13041_c0_seq4:172-1806(+)
MDVFELTLQTLERIMSAEDGMSIMLLDDHTLSLVSMTFGWSMKECFNHEVFQLDKLASNREMMPEVTAIVLLRADLTSLATLQAELEDPKYKEYRLYFTSPLAATDLELLAEADGKHVVTCVEEVYLDVFPIDHHVFSCEALGAYQDPSGLSGPFLQRTLQGLNSLLSGLKLNPCIRYQGNSPQCATLADEVSRQQRTQDPDTLLLILDRRDDLVTPSLLPWTYQALIHDIVGVDQGRLQRHNLNSIQLPAELRHKAFSPFQDAFLRQSRFATWPEVITMQQSLRDKYSQQKKLQEGVHQGSLKDMKTFLLNYDDYESIRDSAELHIGLLTSMGVGFYDRACASGTVDMLDEQTQLFAERKRKASKRRIEELMPERKLHSSDKLRMGMLHCIKHAGDESEAAGIASLLEQQGVPRGCCRAVQHASSMAASGQPGVTGDCFKYISSLTYQQESEVDLFVFQHTPLLATRLKQLEKDNLSTRAFPWQGKAGSRPKRVIVFMVGGIAYEEVKLVNTVNKTTEMQVLLGGTYVHNLSTLCEELNSARS